MITIVEYKEVVFEVDYDYTEEEPMVMYYSDGFGYPGCDAEVIINSVYYGRRNLTDLLWKEIEEQVWDDINTNRYESDY